MQIKPVKVGDAITADLINMLISGHNLNDNLVGDDSHIAVTGALTGRTIQYIGPPIKGIGFFPVLVSEDGGSAGNKTTKCSWTYTVESLSGEVLGDTMTPLRRRPAKGAISKPDDDTVAIGCYVNGTFELYDANEVYEIEVCS